MALDHPEHDEPPLAMHRFGMTDFRDDVAGHLRQVRGGASFLVIADGAAVAELRPAAEAGAAPTQPSLIGAMAGQIWIADDSDTWREDILDAMEGKGE